MLLFSVPAEERETFLENIRGELEEYHTMKEDFFQSPDLFIMFFQADPAVALDQFRSEPGSMAEAIKLLDLPEDMEKRVFRQYSIGNLLVLCTYIYLLILSIGSLVLLLSLLMKRGQSVLGAALGMVFFFYFLNSLSNMAASLSPLAKAVGYISPFTWMDTNFSAPGFGLTGWRVFLFLIVSTLSWVMALKIFKRKNILIKKFQCCFYCFMKQNNTLRNTLLNTPTPNLLKLANRSWSRDSQTRTFSKTSGFDAAIWRSALAGPSGYLLPCSQFRKVPTLIPIIIANSV